MSEAPGIAAPPDALAAAAASGTAGDPTGDAARGAPDDVVLSADGRRIVWILDRAARAAHARLAAEHGGRAGGCDRVKLAAALAWPRTVAAFGDRPPRMSVLAAAHANAIARIRPFREGNDAMACALSMLFLRVNGIELPAPPIEKYAMFSALADRRVDSVALAQWVRMRHLANQRGVESVVAIRVRDGRVLGIASLPGRASGRRAVAAASKKSLNQRPSTP